MEPVPTLPGLETAGVRKVPRPDGRVVRVRPDIVSVDRAFDYFVPPEWERDGRADAVAVGSLVRVDFAGRRTAGWVVEVDVEPAEGVEILPLRKWSSVGPPGELISLAEWASWRWAGRVPHFLRAATPPRMVPSLRPSSRTRNADPHPQFGAGTTLLRLAPDHDGSSVASAAAEHGPTLIIAPTIAHRRSIAQHLRATGIDVAEYPEQWAKAAGGAVTVGTRLAAWAPTPALSSIVVIDEHDSAHKEERTPAWNARDVAVERARRAGIPCVMTSPAPSLESLESADRRLVPERSAERSGWAAIDVVDLRLQDRPGLMTDAIVDVIRGTGPIACILNRKGRARMLACASCGSLATCDRCESSVRQPTDEPILVCDSCGATRPLVCASCSSTHLKLVRPGISRVAEELSALAKREVLEVTAESAARELSGDRLLVGTEALLHRLTAARAVIFLDFDQEVASPGHRTAEDALALLALASRRVGGRQDGGRVVVQTRRPDHAVIDAALHGDPDRLARSQRSVRQTLRQPPYGAWALASGAGAEEYVGSLPEDVDVRRLDDRWRIAAADHSTLLAALSSTARPSERLRLEVDPHNL